MTIVDGDDAAFEADAQDLVLQLHAQPLEAVHFGGPHALEQGIQLLMSVILIALDPAHKSILPLRVLEDPRTFEDRVESFYGVRLNDVLIIFHELCYSLEDIEILKTRA